MNQVQSSTNIPMDQVQPQFTAFQPFGPHPSFYPQQQFAQNQFRPDLTALLVEERQNESLGDDKRRKAKPQLSHRSIPTWPPPTSPNKPETNNYKTLLLTKLLQILNLRIALK